MNGLLDFIKTPEGQGLLSAAFGGMMNARPNAPLNTLGAAGMSGLMGYGGAVDRQTQNELRNMQMQNYQSEIAKRAMEQKKYAEMANMFKPIPTQAMPGQLGSGSFGAVSAPDGMPDVPPAPQSRLSSMTPDQIAWAKMNGLDVTDLWKTVKQGFQDQPGTFRRDAQTGQSTYVPDVKTGLTYNAGQVSALPGFSEANAAIKGAETSAVEGAKASLDLVSVPQADGTTRMMPRAQAVQALGGQASPVLPSGNQDAIRKEQVRIIRGEYDKETDPANREALGRELGRLGSPVLGVSQSPSAAGLEKNITEAGGKINDTWLKTGYEPVVAAGREAQTLIDTSTAARQAMRGMGGTGWGTETKAAAANILAGLGVAPENAKAYATNAQVFQSQAMTRLWSVLNNAKGPQTEGDADRAQKTYAKLGNTTAANEFILDLAQATAERDKTRSTFYNNALPIAQKKGDLSEIEREWGKRVPSVFDMPSMKKWKQ